MDLEKGKQELKLLIIRFSSFGDVILTTPVLAAIKAEHPHAVIDFLVMDKFADAIDGNPHIDNLLLFEKKRGRGIFNIFRFALKLRRNNYTQVIDLHGKVRSILLSYFIGAPVHRYRKRRLWKTVGVKLRLIRYHVDDTIVNNYFTAVRHLGIPVGSEKLRFDYTPEDAAAVESHSDFVVFAPGAANLTKKWLQEHFARLGEMLQEKIIIVGGPEDIEAGDAICRRIGPKCLNLAGKLTLKQSGALIARAKYIVCNDSGPFHIARGVGAKAFVFFGPTDPDMFSYDHNAVLIYAALSCSPCSLHGSHRCPLGHFNCMRTLTPEKVMQIITEAN